MNKIYDKLTDTFDNKLIAKILTDHIVNLQKIPSYTRNYYWTKKFWAVADLFQESLKKHPKTLNVLEVGCDNGSNIFIFNTIFKNKKQFNFYGLDINIASMYLGNIIKKNFSNKNIHFLASDASNLAINSESIDVLISREVLEHLPKPEMALKEFNRVLKIGGSLIITTPNADNIFVRFKNYFKSIKSSLTNNNTQSIQKSGISSDLIKAEIGEGYGHISVKSINEWKSLLKTDGYKIQKVIRGSVIIGGSKWDRRRVLFGFLLAIESILDNLPLFRNFSEDVIILAKKT
ncbi:MAG: class I SAM-dependent methyltransferase [Ignavibacteriales bacterium]|nr:class I SAM-dependent methyltransferase [Ignavibacteriales bacterium]